MAQSRVVAFLIRYRWLLFLVACGAALLGKNAATNVTFDRSIENMFAPNDPLLQTYQKLKRTFGGNEVVMAVYEDPQLLSPDGAGIRRLAEVRRRLKQVSGVRDVLSLDRLSLDGETGRMIVSPLGKTMRDLFEGYTHSREGDVAALVCMLEPRSESDVPRREIVADLRTIVGELPAGAVTGEPAMLADGFELIERDGRALGLWSTILLTLVIVFCFRSLRWVVIPIAVVQWTLLMTHAALFWSGLQLSMVSSMLTAVVTVVGVATVVHIIVRYREGLAGEPEQTPTPHEALKFAGVLLAAPIFWACLTDAAGFASLNVARVGPVRDFGMMMAIGSLWVLPAVAMLTPCLALWGRNSSRMSILFDVVAFTVLIFFQAETLMAGYDVEPSYFLRAGIVLVALAIAVTASLLGWGPEPKSAGGEQRMTSGLSGLVAWTRRRPWRVSLTSLAIVGAAGAGISQLQIETDFTKNFRSDSRLVRAYEFVETRLGGAGVIDIMLPAPEKLDWEYLTKVAELEEKLREEVKVNTPGGVEPGLTKVLSLADVAKPGGQFGYWAALELVRSRMPVFADALHAEDPDEPGKYWLRIMARAKERQPSEEKRRLIEQVTRIAQDEFPEARVTGFFVLLTNLIDSMMEDQWRTFGTATLVIFLMMAIALRGPVPALIALAPNAMPIVVVLGAMGWLGVKVNMGAAMIAAVSIGLSIDSSIHYITSYQRARRRGLSMPAALEEAQLGAGRAVLFATLALIVGFSVLLTSEFIPTVYFGALVSVSMLGALAGNLVILPMLLSLSDRAKVK